MKAAGIICEYNPFHNGHIHHIEQTRRISGCDVLICVMSGDFVQRGEPALISKWERTKQALHHGVDVVVELPFPYATQSAAYFAHGAMQCLALAQVSDLVFGSESADLQALRTTPEAMERMREMKQSQGISTVAAYAKLHGTSSPNDILARCYIQECHAYGIQPHCIQRDNNYHSTKLNQKFASATALRQAILFGKDVSEYTPMCFESLTLHTMDEYYSYFQGLLLSLPDAYLQDLFLMDEGIEHRLIQAARHCDTWEAFLHATISKRYTASNIRRTMIHLLHQNTKAQMNALPPLGHLRVLGFTQTGQRYLKQLRHAKVQIAFTPAQLPMPYRSITLTSAHLYGMFHERKQSVAAELRAPLRVGVEL